MRTPLYRLQTGRLLWRYRPVDDKDRLMISNPFFSACRLISIKFSFTLSRIICSQSICSRSIDLIRLPVSTTLVTRGLPNFSAIFARLRLLPQRALHFFDRVIGYSASPDRIGMEAIFASLVMTFSARFYIGQPAQGFHLFKKPVYGPPEVQSGDSTFLRSEPVWRPGLFGSCREFPTFLHRIPIREGLW